LNGEIVFRLLASFEPYDQRQLIKELIQRELGKLAHGEQAPPRPPAQERPAPRQRPPETPAG
jgi:hypothetical protein